jgi:alpha-tubulin suppressor-like RCC1 family protein
VQVQRLRNVRSVAAGGSEQCALLDAGTVHCWSDGDPKPVDGISDGIALGLGGFDKCAIRSAGGVSCWGSIGATNQELASLAKERLVGIAAGVVHTCVHDAAMKTWCWGGSGAGQLGNGSMLFLLHPSQLPIGGVEELAAGDGWNCARLSSGDVRCWGSVARPSLDPVRWVGVTGLTNVETLCGGGDHMCALAGGSVWCWSKERPDTSDLADPYPPLAASRVVGVSKVTSLACGRTSRCAVAAGGVRCWRDEQPEPVANLKGARAVVVGGRHACARMTNGTVRCWGNNEQGQLGLEGGGDHGAVPTGGLDHVVELAASDTTTCARLENGRVWCWGEHPHGTPVAGHEHLIDAGLANVVSLTAGHGHHCAILGDRRALCWGANKHGQLGNGLMGGRQEAEPPSQGVQLEDITAIAAGAHHSCAVDTALHVWCWGSDADDALMHPETGDSARPVVVAW